ncbi:MAG: sulfurtransferase [Anaerolineae bacterium]
MSTRQLPSPLVQTDWLSAQLDDADVRIVDVRWRAHYHSGRGTLVDDRDGFMAGHIPGAVFVGTVTDLSDRHHPIPDMLVPPEQFAQVMGRLGIGDDTLVVAYDDMGLPVAAARLWWALSYYGHDRVRVLDGGLRKWRAEGRPLSTDVPSVGLALFTPRPRPEWIARKDDVVAALGQPGVTIVDCLVPDLYGSTEHHPWGERPGHIPGAVNVPSLANADPALATATTTERNRLLATDRAFTYAPPDTLASLYCAAGVTS